MQRISIWVGVLAVLPLLAFGGVPQDQRARVHRLERAVLAPCCYTESVGQHQSEIAVKMRLEIAKWVEQGKPDQEILDIYAGRYGAKVLVNPNSLPKEYTLIVPWAVGLMAMLGAIGTLWHWHANKPTRVASSDALEVDLPDIRDIEEE